MNRRNFLLFTLGSIAYPLAARAQPSIPVVGFLNGGSSEGYAPMLNAVREGLKEAGYIEGQNVTIEFGWAEGKYDRLQALAAEMVRRRVDVIAATSTPAALATKSITSTIPIVFTTGADPVELGLVASLSRPGGNVTGVSFLVNQLASKQLELLHELSPKSSLFGFLVNPDVAFAKSQAVEAEAAARALGLELVVVNARSDDEIEAAFKTLIERKAGGLITISEPFLNSRRTRLIELAARNSLPALYPVRDYVAAGGLASYGTSIIDAYRQVGVYTGRILKGEKPADLPVVRSTKLEMVINLKTAKSLGISVPDRVLALADEVIE